jgi:hypothetical protein
MESVEGNGYSTTIPKRFSTEHNTKDIIMKLRKNLEAVFLVAAVVTNFASYAVASAQAGAAVAAAPVVTTQMVSTPAAVKQKMPVVVVKAPRLTAAEKAALN